MEEAEEKNPKPKKNKNTRYHFRPCPASQPQPDVLRIERIDQVTKMKERSKSP
jgi:hypothetical protein